ncbi:MAG TPA: hypothetical protein PLU64_02345 [Saprospiraceae bacterium]|nr:hypothetical protein [Saprospiraceae bacterium]
MHVIHDLVIFTRKEGMEIVNPNKESIENWWALIRHLGAEAKLELASRLIDSLKISEPLEDNKKWKELYGAWSDETESAEELINLIRDSRFLNREIESLD